MKKLLYTLSLLLVAAAAMAQVPQGINYQAVLRDPSGNSVTNQTVNVRISILAGLPPAVYTETHTLATNNYGLVNMVIGQGTPQSGVFADINWANGPYSVQLEADITGGTNYVTYGSQQLMSVPYALYAETSGQPGAVGPTGPAGPQGPQGPQGPTGLVDSMVYNDTIPTNELQNLSVSQLGDTLYLTNGNWVIIPGISVANLAIGDSYQGGIIFYLDGFGGGLIASPSDQATGAPWGCYGTNVSGADGTGVGTGNQNTIDIEDGCTTAGTAADICANLTLNGYSDWFLPSKDELNLMFSHIGQGNTLGLGNIGNFAGEYYWSSSEGGAVWAWVQEFNNGTVSNNASKNSIRRVRAVRAF